MPSKICTSLRNQEHITGAAYTGSGVHLQPMDRFTYVLLYTPIWISALGLLRSC